MSEKECQHHKMTTYSHPDGAFGAVCKLCGASFGDMAPKPSETCPKCGKLPPAYDVKDYCRCKPSAYDKLAEHNGMINRELHASQELAKRMASERDNLQAEVKRLHDKYDLQSAELLAQVAEYKKLVARDGYSAAEYEREKAKELLAALEQIAECCMDGLMKIVAEHAIIQHKSGKGG